MYIDPSFSGLVAQIGPWIVIVVSGIVLAFSGKIRVLLARARRKLHLSHEDESESSE